MVDLSVDAPVKLGPVADFDLPGLRKHLYAKGIDLVWEQANVCPCSRQQDSNMGIDLGVGVTVDTQMRRPDCVLCDGRGYYYHSPITIRAQVVGYKSNPALFSQLGGEYMEGTVMVTLQPEHLPAQQDRLTAVHRVTIYREVRERTAATVERLRYPIVTRTLALSAGSTEVNVLAAQKASAAGLSTAADALVNGTDFDVVGGEIAWFKGDALGTAPAVGDRYAMSYYIHPRWIVVDHPYVGRDTHTKPKQSTREHTALMVQCMARLEWLGDEG